MESFIMEETIILARHFMSLSKTTHARTLVQLLPKMVSCTPPLTSQATTRSTGCFSQPDGKAYC